MILVRQEKENLLFLELTLLNFKFLLIGIIQIILLSVLVEEVVQVITQVVVEVEVEELIQGKIMSL